MRVMKDDVFDSCKPLRRLALRAGQAGEIYSTRVGQHSHSHLRGKQDVKITLP